MDLCGSDPATNFPWASTKLYKSASGLIFIFPPCLPAHTEQQHAAICAERKGVGETRPPWPVLRDRLRQGTEEQAPS